MVELSGKEDWEELELGGKVTRRGIRGRRRFSSRGRRRRRSARPSVGLIKMLGFSRCRLAVHEGERRQDNLAVGCFCRFDSGKWRCLAH